MNERDGWIKSGRNGEKLDSRDSNTFGSLKPVPVQHYLVHGIVSTHRFFVVFDTNTSFAQTFCNSNRHDGRRSVPYVGSTPRIERRVSRRNPLQGIVVNVPESTRTQNW